MQRVMAEIDVKFNLKNVLTRVEKAFEKTPPELKTMKPRLLAVTKTKPVDMVIQAYEAGQRHFGENYVNELVEKANNPEILAKCKDIQWHFIGHLQSNKVNKVLSVPNLHIIETIDSDKLALNVNNRWPQLGLPDSKLKVMVQVNTSQEEEKNGVEPSKVVDLAQFVIENCKNLHLDGIMTIGLLDYNLENGPNPDFLCLWKCREEVCEQLNLDKKQLHLSMGMSADFEHAIELGSTNVRVGTTIFGPREKKMYIK